MLNSFNSVFQLKHLYDPCFIKKQTLIFYRLFIKLGHSVQKFDPIVGSYLEAQIQQKYRSSNHKILAFLNQYP